MILRSKCPLVIKIAILNVKIKKWNESIIVYTEKNSENDRKIILKEESYE